MIKSNFINICFFVAIFSFHAKAATPKKSKTSPKESPYYRAGTFYPAQSYFNISSSYFYCSLKNTTVLLGRTYEDQQEIPYGKIFSVTPKEYNLINNSIKKIGTLLQNTAIPLIREYYDYDQNSITQVQIPPTMMSTTPSFYYSFSLAYANSPDPYKWYNFDLFSEMDSHDPAGFKAVYSHRFEAAAFPQKEFEELKNTAESICGKAFAHAFP